MVVRLIGAIVQQVVKLVMLITAETEVMLVALTDANLHGGIALLNVKLVKQILIAMLLHFLVEGRAVRRLILAVNVLNVTLILVLV